jgi:hypothetical protein
MHSIDIALARDDGQGLEKEFTIRKVNAKLLFVKESDEEICSSFIGHE